MKTGKLNVPRILLLTGSLSLAIVYILSWVEVMSNPEERTSSDFMAFYAAGRSMLDHSPAAAYDLDHLKTNEEMVLGFRIAERDVNPFVHPPILLPVLWVAAHFEYVPAFHLWVGFLLFLCGLCAHIAVKLFPEAEGTGKAALWLGVFLFFPLFISLVNGQDSALLLLGASLWYYGFAQNSSRMAGLGLALTTIRPQIALVLAVPFFFNAGRRQVWWWFCLGGSILVLFSVLLIGWDGVKNFLHILSISAGGEGYKINENAMFNLIGMLRRLLPTVNASTIRTIGWLGNLTGMLLLCLIWWKNLRLMDKHIGLAVIVAIFFSQHLHYHDLALLVIPILVVIRQWIAVQKAHAELVPLLLLFVSLLLVLVYSIAPLHYILAYLMEAGLLAGMWLVNEDRKFDQK